MIPKLKKKIVKKTLKVLSVVATALYALRKLLIIPSWDGMDCAGNQEDYPDPYYAIVIGGASTNPNPRVDMAAIAQREREKVIEQMRGDGQLSYRLQGRCIRL